MEIMNAVFFIVFSAIAVSYGWGMRGTIIGGEKGAMLPGAFMGLLIAAFSGSEVLASSPWILAGVGALGMYCGGNMTYADTLHLTMSEKNPPHFVRNMLGGIFLRGGIWFGLFGGIVSLFISALSGAFKTWQLLIFFALIPAFAFAFFYIFNKPFRPEENVFPKLYFSIKRRETWGGLLGILIEIVIFSAVFKDWSTLAMTGGTFITGAVGWTIAQLLQIRALLPAKNGKRLFENLSQKKYIDAWKIMECVLGALGGMGTAITFLLCRPLFKEKLTTIDTNGFHSCIPENKVTYLLLILYIFILFADCLQYFIRPVQNRKYNRKLLKMKLITKEDYKKAISINPDECISYVRYKKFCEHSEFAVYCIIPLLFSMLGAHLVAALVAFPVLLLVLCQEATEKCIKLKKDDIAIKITYLLPAFATMVLIAVSKKALPISVTMLMYTVFYELCFYLILKLIEHERIFLSNSEKTVHGYFSLCCVIILIMTVFI